MENNDFQITDRELPRSIEAEQSILGAVLADPSVLPLVVEKIKPEYFYSQQHRSLYSIIMRMFTGGANADIITVLNEAEKLHIFENAAEGRRYLANLAEILPSTANIESYCRIVAEKYYIRSLSYAARSILQDVQSGEHNAQILLDSAEQKIYDIREGRNVQGLVPISDAVAEAYDKIGKIAGPDKDKYIGARTGFTYLDSITSGLNKSDLIILAARPAMGKTSFAMNIATNVARRSIHTQ
jgi:replicative DNA helicase